MKVAIIGAGNLATHLSKALQNAGFDIAQVYSRTETSAKELAGLLRVSYTTNISSIVDDASLYVISVSDDSIQSVSKSLTSFGGLVVHTAGSIPMDVFSGRLKNFGVLYPLQTFTKQRPVDFLNIPIFIEANTQENLQILQTVAKSISSSVYNASSQEREQLHLAAVFCCNFVNHLYHLAAQVAQQAGFEFKALSRLILETADKAIDSENPKAVQTGPAVRNDVKVMKKHLELLASRPGWQEIYEMLSKNIRNISHEFTK